MAGSFEWDREKAESNLGKHGVSFDVAIAAFADPFRLVVDATRADEGEVRVKVVGRVAGRLITVVFTMRGEAHRLISARRSNEREERLYGQPTS